MLHSLNNAEFEFKVLHIHSTLYVCFMSVHYILANVFILPTTKRKVMLSAPLNTFYHIYIHSAKFHKFNSKFNSENITPGCTDPVIC